MGADTAGSQMQSKLFTTRLRPDVEAREGDAATLSIRPNASASPSRSSGPLKAGLLLRNLYKGYYNSETTLFTIYPHYGNVN